MPEEPSESFFSKLKNLFKADSQSSEQTSTQQPADEQINELIQNVLKIKGAKVKEIMIPSVNISSITEDDSAAQIHETVKDSRHSRYPVFNQNKDEVIGILHVKDLIDLNASESFSLSDLLRPAKFVPETQSVTSLLEDFKKDRAHLAIVIDEYGMISGLITIEDILEEIVGEIEDEFYEEKNDEVITPVLNFGTAISALIEIKAKPIFIDIEIENLQILIKDIEKKITKKTKAIVPVHFTGYMTYMPKIMKLSKKYH